MQKNDLSFEQFLGKAIDTVKESYDDVSVNIKETTKEDGNTYKVLVVGKENSLVNTCIYLDDFYNKLKKSDDMQSDIEMVLSDMMKVLADHLNKTPQIDVSAFSDYSTAKKNLFLVPVSAERCRKLLKSVPHRIIGDIAVTYHFDIPMEGGYSGHTLVKKDLLDAWGITEDILHADAIVSAMSSNPASFYNMEEALRHMLPGMEIVIPEETIPLWVATTERSVYGAAVMFYPGFFRTISMTIGGDLFIMPSSRNELMIVADDGDMDVDMLKEMVQSVNAEVVAPNDFLSDTVYHYDARADIVETADEFYNRIKRRAAQNVHADMVDSLEEFIGQIIDTFDDLLEEKGIRLPGTENAMREAGATEEEIEANSACIYGDDYDLLYSQIGSIVEAWGLFGEK